MAKKKPYQQREIKPLPDESSGGLKPQKKKTFPGVTAEFVFMKTDGTDYRLNEARARVLWGGDYVKISTK